ncbi:DMT family transporter [Amycolatopsis sp. NBC_01480]|uniref:DMT family transporter n=1 Tax=Amycolatopsis sp. NBC_01480 TaxID=2903562 RepID=UPI002E27AD5A|nr:DMT family transporter [Amycolatopsis sp. NBC_01480]
MSATGVSLFVAVPAAVAGAVCIGLASAAQARATKEVETGKPLDLTLFRRLVGRPLWLIGIAATVLGLGLQLAALAFGPLLLVQPLLITSLIFAGLASARFEKRLPDQVMVGGSVLCVVGLAAFILVARPSGNGDVLVTGPALLPLGIALAAVTAAGMVLAAFTGSGSLRTLGLAVATGVLYGLTAGLMKVVAGQFRVGFDEPFRHWTLYIVCVIGPFGFLLSQNTFQQGRFLTPALAVITALDPLVGVAIGLSWMGESANGSPLALAGEAAAGLVIVVGIALLATRASHLSAAPEPAEATDSSESSGTGSDPEDGYGLAGSTC